MRQQCPPQIAAFQQQHAFPDVLWSLGKFRMIQVHGIHMPRVSQQRVVDFWRCSAAAGIMHAQSIELYCRVTNMKKRCDTSQDHDFEQI